MLPDISRIAATDVPFKTSAGRAEIARRSMELGALERALLIVVDGRQDIAALFAALGRRSPEDVPALAALRRLHDLGLVATGAEAPQPASQRRSLALARLYLIESAGRALRDQATHLQPLLRQAVDEASLLRALAACHQALVHAGARGQADAMRTRCLELLPVVSPPAPPSATDH
ncbi:MAG TPA: hypothetical protein VIO81_05070 [Methyloversatilis sp.]